MMILINFLYSLWLGIYLKPVLAAAIQEWSKQYEAVMDGLSVYLVFLVAVITKELVKVILFVLSEDYLNIVYRHSKV